MSRDLDLAAYDEIGKKLGTKPIIILEIGWSDITSSFYADKEISWAEGRILNISNIDEIIKLENRGVINNISVELDDSAGTIKNLVDTIDIHKKVCRVWQWYEGLSQSDKFLLCEALVTTPITWKEKTRSVSFELLTKIEYNEAGFSPEEGYAPTVAPRYIGKPWPLCFGAPIHVPATMINQVATGTTATFLALLDNTLGVKIQELVERAQEVIDSINYHWIILKKMANATPNITNVKNDYIDAIKERNDLKQTIADFAENVAAMQKLVDNLQFNLDRAGAADKPKIEQQINADKAQITNVQIAIKDAQKKLYDELWKIKSGEFDLATIKHWYDSSGEVIKRLNTFCTELNEINYQLLLAYNALNYEASLMSNNITVVNYQDFPQATDVDVIINNVKFTGQFSDNIFTYSDIKPTYKVNVVSNPTSDSFEIDDSTVNLVGLWCYNNGNIFRVKEQIGTVCYVDPVELKLKDLRRREKADHKYELTDEQIYDAFPELGSTKYYTKQEQEKMKNSAISSADKTGELKKLKKHLDDINDQLQNAVNKQEQDDLKKDFLKTKDEYDKILAKLLIPASVLEKCDKKCKDQELKNLVKLEQLKVGFALRVVNPKPAKTPTYWFTGGDVSGEIEASGYVLGHWLTAYYADVSIPIYVDGVLKETKPRFYMPDSNFWIAQPGAVIKNAADYQEKYIANILSSTVVSVYAYRGVEGIKKLMPIPTNYYIKDENESFGNILLADESTIPMNCTTISLKKPLSEYVGEGWEGGNIYVTCESSIGPNVVDIIEWLIETYTDWTCDGITFAAVRTKVDPYPANFALLNKQPVIDLINQIAWQARCTIHVDNKVAKIIFLPAEPTSLATFTESDIEFGSFEISSTESENLITKLTAKWKSDYSDESQQHPFKTIIRYNIKKYGVIEREYDFFIYNQKELVLHAATFWSMRLANTWKKVKFNTFLTHLDLQTQDAITLDITPNHYADSSIKAIIDKLTYNSDNQSISVEMWLPVRLGEMEQYTFAWPADLTSTTIYPSLQEIAAGYAGNPYYIDIEIPTVPGSPLPPNYVPRPPDYGDMNIGDATPINLANPLDGLGEEDVGVAAPVMHDVKLEWQDEEPPEDEKVCDFDINDENNDEVVEVLEPEHFPVFIGRIKEYDLSTQTYLVTRPDGIDVNVDLAQNDTIGSDTLIGRSTYVVYDNINQKYRMLAEAIPQFGQFLLDAPLVPGGTAMATLLDNSWAILTFFGSSIPSVVSERMMIFRSVAGAKGRYQIINHELVVINVQQLAKRIRGTLVNDLDKTSVTGIVSNLISLDGGILPTLDEFESAIGGLVAYNVFTWGGFSGNAGAVARIEWNEENEQYEFYDVECDDPIESGV